jgi:uncharacterized protein (TIGR02145 family)
MKKIMKKYLLRIIAITFMLIVSSQLLYTQQVTDIDGNTYNTVSIGTQVWMEGNLKTSKYNDGTAIPNITVNTTWAALTTGAYSDYNNTTANSTTYGRLYNWYTVDNNAATKVASNGGRNVCPTSWHIPTDAEWTTLTTYLGGESVAGGKLKETGTTHWTTPNTGATNETGFTALPGGYRDSNGPYGNVGNYGYWWSSTEGSLTSARTRSMSFLDNTVNRATYDKRIGYSIRCINDFLNATLTTTSVSNIAAHSATSGGNITSDGGAPITRRGVCWSITSNPTITDNHTNDGSGTGIFTSLLVELLPSTTYYVRAYATNSTGTAYGNEVAFTTAAVGSIIFNPNLTYGTITDIDNNAYKTIRIGNQMWMAENLKVTRFTDGTSIANVFDNNAWANLTGPGYCWYNNDFVNFKDTYGAIYNYYSVANGNLCPDGWHVPTDAEWSTLTTFLGGESIAGEKLKEAGTTHWTSPNTGATNETGFTSLPGGYRIEGGNFYWIGIRGNWWTSTRDNYSWLRSMFYNASNVERAGYQDMTEGFSVRCLMNPPTATISGTTTVCQNALSPNITFTGANGTAPYTFTYTINGGANQIVTTISGNSVNIAVPTSAAGSFTYNLISVSDANTVSQAQSGSAAITITPANTITLTSVVGTNTQTECINTAITDITYSTTGATGATFAGLPTGVTGAWLGNVVTISGTPTASGPFTYTVTLTGGCGAITTTGSITVTPNKTISLTSAAGTDAQTVCINTAITNITYATTGATGATVTGLPAGVTGAWAAGVITISGTPTASGPFTYTVTLTGGCGAITTTGSITITANNTVSLTSAAGTDAQTVCISTVITNITYATTGATDATVTGLPAGVTGTWLSNVFTISGTPTASGPFTYTVTLTGGCGATTTTGTITVTTNNTVNRTSPTGTDAQTVCINTAITNITYTTTGATGATISGLPAGVTGAWAANAVTINGAPTASGTFSYTISLNGGCGTATATGTIVVTGLPVATFTYTLTPYCSNETDPSPVFSGGGVAGTFSSTTGLVFINPATGQVDLSASTPGTYNVTNTIAAAGGCGLVTATAPITITATPVATFSYSGTPYCSNEANPSPTFSGGGGAGTFSSTAGLVFVNTATGQVNLSASTSGTYIVTNTIAAAGGCGLVTATTQMTITATPVATFSYSGTPYCSNAANPLPVFSGGGVAGTFSSTAGLVFVSTATGQVNLSVSAPGIYTVTNTIAGSGGCGVVTATTQVTITAIPGAPTIGTITNPTCSVATGSVVLNGLPSTVTWTITTSPGGTTYLATGTSYTITGLASGSYTFTVNSSGCTSPASGNVIINAQPATPTAPIVGTITQPTCALATGSVALNGLPSGSWTINPGGIAGSTTSTTLSGLAANTYNFAVTNASGCTSPASGNIVINVQPVTPTATALSSGPLIPGSSLSLIGGPGGMLTYSWTGPNGFVSTSQNPVISTSATPDMAGVYTLTVTSSSGCQNSASTIVESNPLIVTNVNDNGIGSLRYAMNYANSNSGTDIITFSIPGYGPFTIQPQIALPTITDPVIIDGYSQPGASATSPLLLIEIDGTYAGSVNGLNISSSNCTVKGLIINSFSGYGIQITGSGTNSILGNYIGVDYSGTVPKGNKGDGINITGSSNNKIGGANPGDGNVISANTGAGISIIGNSAIGNLISSNSIYSNGGIGIDLGGNGVTSNDTGDPDTGPNNLQNFPVLGPATFSTGSVTITGSLNSKASTTYNLQFFASVLADNSGNGEGQTYLGSKSVTTGTTVDVSFTQAFAIKSSSGTVITATATDPNGNTSEFSKSIGGYQDQKIASSNWPFKYTLNADGVPNITDGSDLTAVRAAFNTWAAISTSTIKFTDGGTTTSKYANATDGVNLVSFEDDQFPFSYGVLAVAAKTLQVDPVTNVAQIIDADIVVNPDFVNDIKYNLGILDNAKNKGYFDIQSVITHEIGHVLGLLHSPVVGATMFFTMGSGTNVRTLEQDDISWASYGYPSSTYNTNYGSISGNITYGYGGQPVAGAIVYAISTSRRDSVHAYSDAQGNYLVPGLIPGSYYIYIEPLDGNVNGYNLRPGNISPYIYANTIYTDYPGEFYNNPDKADEPNDSKSIVTVVAAGSNTSGINLITNIDLIPPYVVSVSATDVSGSLVNITTNFSIKFSEAVDETSLSNATCYLTAGTKTIGGSYTILGNNVVLFDPESLLDYGTGYILHITKGVTDLRGNPLQPEFTKNFTTVPKDIVPPEVNEVIPANGATGVFVTDKIIVFFSKPMNKSSVEKGFVLSSGGLVLSGSFSWDDANTVVTFSPYASLKEAKTGYTITLPNSITDLSGNPLASSTYSFTTVATAPPTITYLGPANLSTGVPITTPIVVDFSEPINIYTVTSTTFKLLLGTTNTTVTGQFEFLNENSRVVFTPAANLNFNQIYTISLTTGIQDVSLPTSSSLKASTSTFTTAAKVTVPDILYLDPSNGVAGDKVIITGTGFDPNPVKNVVTFNGLNATVTSATLTSLTTVVPQGALSGPVAVTVNTTASDNTMYFGVIPQSLNPCSNILGNQPTGSSGHGVGLTDAVSVSGVHTTYAYVTNPDQGTVSVVNLTTPSETPKSITVGDTPMNIAINPQGTKAYVTNFNSHNVSVIDLVSNKVINTITVGIEPYDLAVTPDGKRVYVANYYSENVSMIDEDPNSGGFDHSTVTIATPSKTTSMTATTDNAMVLITDEFGLKIIDSNPADKDYNSITANVSTGSPANGVTATGDAALAIVSTVDGHLLMINLHPENGDYSEAITANVSTGSNGGGKPSGSGDNMFVYLPDTEHNQVLVYQIGIGTGGSGSANGSGISGLTLILHNTIPIPTGAPVALAISSDARRLYVLDTKTGTSNSEITTVAICCGPITPTKTIGDLIIAIQDMINTGAITKLRGYALIVTLNSALRNINANRPNLAILDLTAFNVLVNTYIKNKQITSAQGNALVNSATALINQLKGTKSALSEPFLADTAQVNQNLIPVSRLGVIYPNPFSQTITINYNVAEKNEAPAKVQIMIYDINGKLVESLVDEIMQSGCYTASWNGTYDDGTHAPYGTYFVLFRAGNVVETGKIMLIKPR